MLFPPPLWPQQHSHSAVKNAYGHKDAYIEYIIFIYIINCPTHTLHTHPSTTTTTLEKHYTQWLDSIFMRCHVEQVFTNISPHAFNSEGVAQEGEEDIEEEERRE